jgi:RNA 3'-terminal phosphate cyclase-like protein
VREIFNDYIPDVWIHTDHYKKEQCGEQPAFAISLEAETTTGVIYTKDFMFGKEFKMPEDLGERAAYAMLDEIFTGGATDSSNQPTLLLLASLASGDNISSIKLARITEQSIQMLRHLKNFFNI